MHDFCAISERLTIDRRPLSWSKYFEFRFLADNEVSRNPVEFASEGFAKVIKWNDNIFW